MGITKQKIAFISPYLDILGGGERFLLSIAEYLSQENNVSVFWNRTELFKDAGLKLGINLHKSIQKSIPTNSFSLFSTLLQFQYFFFMTDGSLFLPGSCNNYLIIQSPVHIPRKTFVNAIKLKRFRRTICYSEFVANYIKRRIGISSIIIPPPVLTERFKPGKKENIILSVGRFFPYLHSKKQEVLIDCFRQFIQDDKFSNWRLVLIGSIDRGTKSYFCNIQKKAKNLPIEIITDANIDKLAKYYARAKIYWHAAGYGENLDQFPERAEHFGITTIESMAAGCVPLVFNGGGQKEIINDRINGRLWSEADELIRYTKEIIEEKDSTEKMSLEAISSSKKYSKEVFINKINHLLNA